MKHNPEKTVREPLVHLTRRSTIRPLKAWLIRIAAFALGLLVCGMVAFLLVEKLQQNPERIGDFYQAFIRGSFSTARRTWKFFKNLSILLCIALALTPAFRMRFWNIGAEGRHWWACSVPLQWLFTGAGRSLNGSC